MSSIDVIVVVEGQTESTFVRDILAPYMAVNDIYLSASIIGRPGHKGGAVSFKRAIADIRLFLSQRSNTYVTTMFDYYAIAPDWPGVGALRKQIRTGQTLSLQEKAKQLEDATLQQFKKEISEHDVEKRVIPYFQMHEFEALLFSDASKLAEIIGVNLKHVQSILEHYNEPEAINDKPETAPSKQIYKLCPGFRKIAMGIEIAESISIDTMRQKCNHFNDWLTRIEQLIRL